MKIHAYYGIFGAMKDLIWNEFPESGYDDWKKQVLKELGGKDYSSIVWRNTNGFDVQPYFNEGKKKSELKKPDRWDIYQSISGNTASEINSKMLESLNGGANAIGITTTISSAEMLDEVLKDVHVAFISLHFTNKENPIELVDWIVQYCTAHQIEAKSLRGSCRTIAVADPSSDVMKNLAILSVEHFSLFKVFPVNVAFVHECGGRNAHELAYALATGNEFLHEMTNAGIRIDDVSAMLQFNFSTGSSYFAEIAKYRAFRVLWKTIVEQYHPGFDCSGHCSVHAETSRFLQTTKDHYNNLLRATTQTMSAIIGGANSVEALPVYEQDKSESSISLRIARNIQHLLMEESYLQQAGDVASGSYYIESLTEQLSNAAWDMFLHIEKMGGISEASEWLNEQLDENLAQQRIDLNENQTIVVGVNKYKNKSESVIETDTNALTGFLERE